MKAALWLRVSDPGQTMENQLAPIQEYAERRGLHVVHVYEDTGVSAYQGKQEKYLSEVLKDARLGRFEVLLCWSLDRMSREGPRKRIADRSQVWRCRLPGVEPPGALDRSGR